jgi:hypothetical protein
MLARALRFALTLTLLGYLIYFLTQVLAYGILIFAYVSQTRSLTRSDASLGLIPLFGIVTLEVERPFRPFGPLVEYHPIPEIVLLFLISCVAVQTGLNYSASKERNALLVFLGFLFLALSHLLFVLMPFSPLFFVIGHTFQLLGFVSLLTMLLRVTKTS